MAAGVVEDRDSAVVFRDEVEEPLDEVTLLTSMPETRVSESESDNKWTSLFLPEDFFFFPMIFGLTDG